jgi:cytochrome c biogenesis protein
MAGIGSRTRSFLRRLWHFLVRIDVAVVLILGLLCLAALGSCFPQRPSSPNINAEMWQEAVQARYGALTGFLEALGLFGFFHSPALVLALALLGLATLVCTINRWRPLWSQAFHREVRFSDTVFDHSSLTAEVALPAEENTLAQVRDRLSAHGYRVRVESIEKTTYIRGERNRWASLGSLLTHVGLLLLLLGAVLSGLFSWREELIVQPSRFTPLPYRQDLAIVHEGFTIQRYPDGSAADYLLQVQLLDSNEEVARGVIRVNEPLNHDGVGLYLMGFVRTGERYTVSLLAVRDPGYGPVIIAGMLLLFGMTVSFNFPHSCIYGRTTVEGMLRLAGRADRRAYAFDREFSAIAAELKAKSSPEAVGLDVP